METAKIIIARIFFYFGYNFYKLFGFTPKVSYLSLRKLYYTSNGQFNNKISNKISLSTPPEFKSDPATGILGTLDEVDIKKISEKIKMDGYYIFETELKEEMINDLMEFSLNTDARLIPSDSTKFEKYNREEPSAVKYQFQEQDLIQNKTVQSIMADNSLIAVAQNFLGTTPILDMISMWWSTTLSKEASTEVAQLYHFDMERIKFLKFFIYLTDVDENTGPHCYVKGSTSREIPEEVKKDGRIPDHEISKAYGKDNLIEITGKKGTILAVDTSGFHKGKKLEKDDRLLFQLEFTNSLFGIKNSYYSITDPSKDLSIKMQSYPRIYKRYSK